MGNIYVIICIALLAPMSATASGAEPAADVSKSVSSVPTLFELAQKRALAYLTLLPDRELRPKLKEIPAEVLEPLRDELVKNGGDVLLHSNFNDSIYVPAQYAWENGKLWQYTGGFDIRSYDDGHSEAMFGSEPHRLRCLTTGKEIPLAPEYGPRRKMHHCGAWIVLTSWADPRMYQQYPPSEYELNSNPKDFVRKLPPYCICVNTQSGEQLLSTINTGKVFDCAAIRKGSGIYALVALQKCREGVPACDGKLHTRCSWQRGLGLLQLSKGSPQDVTGICYGDAPNYATFGPKRMICAAFETMCSRQGTIRIWYCTKDGVIQPLKNINNYIQPNAFRHCKQSAGMKLLASELRTAFYVQQETRQDMLVGEEANWTTNTIVLRRFDIKTGRQHQEYYAYDHATGLLKTKPNQEPAKRFSIAQPIRDRAYMTITAGGSAAFGTDILERVCLLLMHADLEDGNIPREGTMYTTLHSVPNCANGAGVARVFLRSSMLPVMGAVLAEKQPARERQVDTTTPAVDSRSK